MRIIGGEWRRRIRQGWIAFCSGWWLAGIVFGIQHFFELLGRSGTTGLEQVGAPLVSGVFLPGTRPFWYAAEVLGVTGLPVGFTGILVGTILGVAVWTSLPVVIYLDSRERMDQVASRTLLLVAAMPYAAAVAGLGYLYRTDRTPGRTKVRVAGTTLASAAVAYLVCAAAVFAFGYAYLP